MAVVGSSLQRGHRPRRGGAAVEGGEKGRPQLTPAANGLRAIGIGEKACGWRCCRPSLFPSGRFFRWNRLGSASGASSVGADREYADALAASMLFLEAEAGLGVSRALPQRR